MNTTATYCQQKPKFLKLSLKKNRALQQEETKLSRSSDVIILDESSDRLQTSLHINVHNVQKIYSPIVIDDSHEMSRNSLQPAASNNKGNTISDSGKIVIDDSCDALFDDLLADNKTSSKNGNVSINCSIEERSDYRECRPSVGGWSPAQNFLCATPRHELVPSTPKDIHNQSTEECSIKKIQQSQKKILTELYGDVWKSLPSLFKTKCISRTNDGIISKKLNFDHDESDKENINLHIKKNKELYLTDSNAKRKVRIDDHSDKKSKKRLYTEAINTPEPPKALVKRNVNSTSKKIKGKTVTEMVKNMEKAEVEEIVKRVHDVKLSSKSLDFGGRLSFMASLADDVPPRKCHVEAIQYRDHYSKNKEQLARRLYSEFNREVFTERLDHDMLLTWSTKLRSTAGITVNRRIKTSTGVQLRTSSIQLSTKVVDNPQRLRDTLIHEMCHAATWLIDGELKAGHGPLWKNWAKRALRAFPELEEISTRHDLEIYYKYKYVCTKCGYSFQRHSKSIDLTKKCCGYCRGKLELQVNRKNKDGHVVSTPARKCGPNDFALYVKQHYGAMKDGTKTHAQVMKLLGEQFSARKNKNDDSS